MLHPLQSIMNETMPLVLIGDSSEGRFPGFSYSCYTKVGRPFYCMDLGGLEESRGPTKGGKVYTSVEDLPDDRGDLAIVWMKRRSAIRGVDMAHAAACKRIWFSFGTGHPDAVARARELDMKVVEVGRCPVYYLDRQSTGCKLHTLMVKMTAAWGKPPQTEADGKGREIW